LTTRVSWCTLNANMRSALKKFFAITLIIAFTFSGSPAWAAGSGKLAPNSFFSEEEGPFTKRFYRGRVPQALDIPVGQHPQIPTLPEGGPPSLNISLPEVENSSYLSEILSVPNDPYYSSKGSLFPEFRLLDDLWGVKFLNAEAAWDLTRGSGIVVAVVDTGVYLNHAELQGNIWFNQREKDGVAGVDDDGNGFIDDVNGWDFSGNDNDPSDLNGHGTHVAGIIGALKDNNKGIVGIAPETDIMAVRVLDGSGSGSWSDVSDGVRYAASMGAKVINLSLGDFLDSMTSGDLNDILGAIRYARDLGAIVVAAAGNSDGDIANAVPAAFEEVISVGALRHPYDTYYGSGPLSRADFSEKGEELDFMAPGADILSLAVNSSTYAGYRSFLKDGSYYSAADGTSMAAPMVSGLIALLLAQNPLQTFSDIYRRLKYSSGDLGDPGFDPLNGWGSVNAFKALSEDYYDNGVVKKRFYPNGSVLSYSTAGVLEKKTFPNGDILTYFASGNLKTFFESSTGSTYEYLDENFYGNDAEGHGRGRVFRTTLSDGDFTEIGEYWQGTDKVKKVSEAHPQSGSVWRKISIKQLPDSSQGSYSFPSFRSDMNGDGHTDLVLSDKSYDPAHPAYSRLIVIFGEEVPQKTYDIDSPDLNGQNGFIFQDVTSNITFTTANDLNGDGYADIVVQSEKTNFSSGDKSGGAYVIFGKSNGFPAVLRPGDLDGENGFTVYDPRTSGSGSSYSYSPDDLNGDQKDDLILRYIDGTGKDETYVLYGKSGGYEPTANLASLNGQNGFVIKAYREVIRYNTRTEYRLSNDVNGDGINDIIATVTGYDPSRPNAVKVYVIYGSQAMSSVVDLNTITLTGRNGFVIDGFESLYYSFVDGQYDLNGDGICDLLIDPNRSGSGTPVGSAPTYVVFGSHDQVSSINVSALNGSNGFSISAASAPYGFDYSTRSDINRDGLVDLILRPSGQYGSDDTKDFYVIYGKNEGYPAVIDADHLSVGDGFMVRAYPQSGSRTIETSLGLLDDVLMSDINGDGYEELAFSVRGYDPNNANAVKTYVLFGRERFTEDIDLASLVLDGSNGFVIEGMLSQYTPFPAAYGDINGDGYRDLSISSGYTGQADGSGALYFIYGSAAGFPPVIRLSELNGINGFKVTEDVGSVGISHSGDYNHDGYTDFMISLDKPDSFTYPDYVAKRNYHVLYGQASPFPAVLDLRLNPFSIHEYEYYLSGNEAKEVSPAGEIVERLDENFYGADEKAHGQGRITRRFEPGGDETRYLEYWPDTDKVKVRQTLRSGILQKTEDFYLSGQVKKELLASGSFTTYHEDGVLESAYDAVARELKEYNAAGILIRITKSSGEIDEFYVSGNYKTIIYNTGFRAEFLDENFYNTQPYGSGRYLRTIDLLGQETRYVSYWQNTSSVRVKEFYLSGALIKTLEYAQNGFTVLKKILPQGDIYTYYPPVIVNQNIESYFQFSGGITVFYLNENFYGRDAENFGRGRKSRELFSDGRETRYIAYWSGTDKIKIKELYQSGVLIKTLEYASDGVTLLKTTLPGGDVYTFYSNGNLKTFYQSATLTSTTYLDENFYGYDPEGHGQGRKSLEVTAAGREIRYIEYWPGTATVKLKQTFQSGLLQKTEEFYLSGQLRKALLASGSYTTYYQSGALQSSYDVLANELKEYNTDGILLRINGPAGTIFEFYLSGNYKSKFTGGDLSELLDENFYGFQPYFPGSQTFGTGRLIRTIRYDGLENRYIEYWPGTDHAKIKELYQNGVFQKRFEYTEDGAGLLKVTFPSGNIYTFYPASVDPMGRIETIFDAATSTLTSFLNETFYGSDPDGYRHGRKSKELFPDGRETRYIAYWPGTINIKAKELYQAGVLQKTFEYAEDGATLTKILLPDGDVYTFYPSGNLASFFESDIQTTFTYLDENFYGLDAEGHGRGRTSSVITDDRESRFTEYWPGTDHVKLEEVYQSSLLIRTIQYHASGQADFYTTPHGDVFQLYLSGNYKSAYDTSGDFTLDFYDENFYGTDPYGYGTGRRSRQVYGENSEHEERYLEYWEGTDTLKIAEYYESGVFVKRVETYEDGVSVSKITLPNGDIREHYLNNNIKSFFEASSGITTEYYNEPFSVSPEGFSLGRRSKVVHPDGAEIRFLTYWNGTDIPRIKAFYQSGVYVKTVEYDRNGRTEKKVVLANGDEYEYYLSGNLKSSLIHDVFEEYLDENFYGAGSDGHGKGRISRRSEEYSEVRYKDYFRNTDVAKTIEYYYLGVLDVTETYNRWRQPVKIVYGDGAHDTFDYYSASGGQAPKLSLYRAYNAAGKLLSYEKYDVTGRLTKAEYYIEDANRALILYSSTHTYGSRTVSSKVINYTYSQESPLKLLSVNEGNYLSGYPFDQANLGAITSGKDTTYVYNEKGQRFVEVQQEVTYYYDLQQPNNSRLKNYHYVMNELTPSGNGIRKIYVYDEAAQADGQSSAEEKSWDYHDNGRTSRYTVTTLKNDRRISGKIYVYDTRGRVTETHTITFYASGNVKTERLEKAKITYEYKDEDFFERKGRLAKKTNSNGTYETYAYWGVTDQVSTIEYFRANGTRYRVEHFDRSPPESLASVLEASAFGGDGYLEMLDKKAEQRRTGSSQNPQAVFTARAVSDL